MNRFMNPNLLGQPAQPFRQVSPLQALLGGGEEMMQQAMPRQAMQPAMNPRQNRLAGLREMLPDIMIGLGAGLASGNPGATAAIFQQQLADGRERKQRDASKNATLQWMRGQAAKNPMMAELIGLVEAGALTPADAFKMAQQRPEKPTPYTDAAKARADFNAGLIDEETYRRTLNPQPDMEKQFATEQGLRKEYNAYDPVKQYSGIRDSYERVRASAQRAQSDTTGASDMAMIFNYMKMLDPGSVVRETEFENAARSGGYGPRIQNLVNQITSGKMLTPKQRQEFVDTADKLYSEASQNVMSANERYGPIADQYGVDRSRVLMQPEEYEPLQIGETIQVSPGVTMRRTR